MTHRDTAGEQSADLRENQTVQKKIIVALTAGTLGLSGMALAAPALASTAHAGTHSSSTATSTARASAKTTKSAKISTQSRKTSSSTRTSSQTGDEDTVSTVLAGLVTDSTLTQAQADKVAAALKAAGIAHGHPGAGGPRPHGAPAGGAADLSAAATALGLSEADLRTALQSGKSLAQVAQTQNVDVDTLVEALVTAETARITADVTAGKLTQAQADKRLANLTARITERVNRTRPGDQGTLQGGPGGRGGKGATPSTSPSS